MIYETFYGHGTMTCPHCDGKGYRVYEATTVANECWVCLGVGRLRYAPHGETKPKSDTETKNV